MDDDLEIMPGITKLPLIGFVLDDEFPPDKAGILQWYDGPLEQHWIRRDGRDYINTFLDTDDRRCLYPRQRELVFRIEPKIFLEHQKGEYSFSELIEMSEEDYLVIEYGHENNEYYTKVWLLTLDELKKIYNDELPFGTAKVKNDTYGNYYDDVMRPYLINKIRDSKIKSLKL